MKNYMKVPENIEKKSFEIITKELGDEFKNLKNEEAKIIKRVIHTTADFEYAKLIKFINNPIEEGKKALKDGCKIYCDTNMISNGLNNKILKTLNCEVYCLVKNEMVIKEARERKVTRSIVAIEKASKIEGTKIFLIGNAPTALYRLKEMIIKKEMKKPSLVVGVPVGFVGAKESKEYFKDIGIPYITIDGRKGGSTVAVSILHGILYQIYKRKGF